MPLLGGLRRVLGRPLGSAEDWSLNRGGENLDPVGPSVGGLTCAVPSDLAAKVATVKVNDRAEIKCSLISSVNTLTKIDVKR